MCVRYVVRYIGKGKLPTCITLILGIWLNYFQYISRPQLLAGTTRMVKRSVFFCPLTKVGLLQWGRRQWWPTRQPILNARDLRELATVEAETVDFCMKSDTDVTRDMFDIDELISSHLNFSFYISNRSTKFYFNSWLAINSPLRWSTFYLDRIHSSITSPHQICVFVEVSTPWWFHISIALPFEITGNEARHIHLSFIIHPMWTN